MRSLFLLLLAALLAACDDPALVEPLADSARVAVDASPPIPPLKAVPTEQQLAWQRGERYLFVHFGVNTFTGREWGTGVEHPDDFAPTGFEPEQWARVARETGFEGLIFTAKHHDGFALWPTRTTAHSVAASRWRGGEADVVGEVAEAVRAAGLRFGLYLSPWDRNAPSYGTPAYNDLYAAQLEELLTGYGPLFEIWMDGAGPPGAHAYDFRRFHALVRAHQPDALIAIGGPDIRWAGNEAGYAPEPAWSPVDDTGWWYPFECDVPNRPGWFWRPEEDVEVKSFAAHLDLYFECVGRNGVLLLNVPPNAAGRFAEPDVERLRALDRALDDIFADDLARGARATATSVRGAHPGHAPYLAVDGHAETFWAAADSLRAATLELDLRRRRTFNVVELREPIRYGQRVIAHRVEVEQDGTWRTVARGTTVGYKRLHRIPPVRARRVRVVVEDARGAPALEAVGLYANPYDAAR